MDHWLALSIAHRPSGLYVQIIFRAFVSVYSRVTQTRVKILSGILHPVLLTMIHFIATQVLQLYFKNQAIDLEKRAVGHVQNTLPLNVLT